MAKLLTIDWREGDLTLQDGEYDRKAGSIDESAIFAKLGNEGRPLVLWVWDPEVSGEDQEMLEKKMFGSEDLAVTTKWFDCTRLPNDVVDMSVKKKILRSNSGFIVFDGNGNMIARKGGVVPVRTLQGMLNKAFKKTFAKSPAKMVKRYTKYLRDLEQAEDGVALANAKIKTLNERISKRASASAQRQLEEAKVELADAQKELSKLREQGRGLLDLEGVIAKR